MRVAATAVLVWAVGCDAGGGSRDACAAESDSGSRPVLAFRFDPECHPIFDEERCVPGRSASCPVRAYFIPWHISLSDDGRVAHLDVLGSDGVSDWSRTPTLTCGYVARFRVGLEDGTVVTTGRHCIAFDEELLAAVRRLFDPAVIHEHALCAYSRELDVEVRAVPTAVDGLVDAMWGGGVGGDSVRPVTSAPLVWLRRGSTGEVLRSHRLIVPMDGRDPSWFDDRLVILPELGDTSCCLDSCVVPGVSGCDVQCGYLAAPRFFSCVQDCELVERVTTPDGICHVGPPR